MIRTTATRLWHMLPMLTATNIRGPYSILRSFVEIFVYFCQAIQLLAMPFTLSGTPWDSALPPKIALGSQLVFARVDFMGMFWGVTSLTPFYVILALTASSKRRLSWHRGFVGFYLGRSIVFGLALIPTMRYVLSMLLCSLHNGKFYLKADPKLQCWTTLHFGAISYALFVLTCLIGRAIAETRASDILTHEISNPFRSASHIVFLRSKTNFFMIFMISTAVYLNIQPTAALTILVVATVFPIIYFVVRLPLMRPGNVGSVDPDLDPQEIERRLLLASHEVPSIANDLVVGLFTAMLWLEFVVAFASHYPFTSEIPFYLLVATPLAFAVGFHACFFRRRREIESIPSLSLLPQPGSEEALWRHPAHIDIVPVSVWQPAAKTVRILSDDAARAFGQWFGGNARVRALTVLGRNRLIAVPPVLLRGLSARGFDALLASMTLCPALTSLALVGHNMDDEAVLAVARGLLSLPQLVSVDLSGNGLGDQALSMLVRELSRHPRLWRVNIARNAGTRGGLEAVKAALEKGAAVRVVDDAEAGEAQQQQLVRTVSGVAARAMSGTLGAPPRLMSRTIYFELE